MNIDVKQLQAEVQANFSNASWEAYEKIRDSYLVVLHGNYDHIRDEIMKCITFQLFQASITLTNHLLELLLKDCLIINDLGTSKLNDPTVFSKYETAAKKYDSLMLNQTINEAKDRGIINLDEYNKLKDFKNKFRNAYSHGEKAKIFKGSNPVNFGFGKLDGSQPLQTGTVEPQYFFVAHGEMQAAIASQNAIEYFKDVDKLVIQIEKRHHPEIEIYPEAYKRHFNL
ncbi:hypothetical protein [Mucilaginibacter defluvii]|uniref:HEPN AbiU2-like domain-containing protein n=1 Tax=Mucilaginibacter defluvii TaxID=1196019 RepID=A0ABP9G7R9_9SPHI